MTRYAAMLGGIDTDDAIYCNAGNALILIAGDILMKDKHVLNAYMTIEASFIMVWVLFLIIFLLYTSFYMYDRCVMFQDSYAIAFRSSIQPVQSDQINTYINRHMGEQFGEKYIASGRVLKEARVSSGKVVVHASQVVSHPFPSVDPTLMNNRWVIDGTVEAQILNPTKLVRTMRKVELLVTK